MKKYEFEYTCMNDGVTAFVHDYEERIIYCPKCGAIMSPSTVREVGDSEYCFHTIYSEPQSI